MKITICVLLFVCLAAAGFFVFTPARATVNPALANPSFAQDLQGLHIRMVAPSSGIDDDTLKKIEQIQQVKFELSKRISSYAGLPYHSNTDEVRFNEMKDALYQDDVQVIWAVRGGYGAARVAEDLIPLKPPQKPKILIGYSDITALHLLFSRWGWKSIHGAMISDLFYQHKSPENFLLLAQILSGKLKDVSYGGLRALNKPAETTPPVHGTILGGNLLLLVDSLGTDWQIQGDGKIVFIEFAYANGHTADRHLNHLKQAGVFKHAKAVLLGDFIAKDAGVDYALQRFADDMNIPVYQTPVFGHGDKNFPLVFGCESLISRTSPPAQQGPYSLKINLAHLF